MTVRCHEQKSPRSWRGAFHRAHNKNGKRCPSCGLFGCICKTSVQQFINQRPIMRKNKCLICGFFLCGCPCDANDEPLFGGCP